MDVYILPDSAPGISCHPVVIVAPALPSLPFPPPYQSIDTTSAYVTLPYNSTGDGYTLYVTLAGQPIPLFNGGYSFNVGSLSVGSIRTIVLVDTGCTDPCNGGR